MYDDSCIILNVTCGSLNSRLSFGFSSLVQGYPEASLTVCMHVYVMYENKSSVTAIKIC